MRRQMATRELTAERPRRGQGGRPGGRSVAVNLAESPLAWLHARGHLDDRLFDTSEQLRADYKRASLGPSVTMRWGTVRIRDSGYSGLNSTERQIAAKARFDGAMAAAGSGLSDILWRVACGCESLPDAEKEQSWPVRSGKLVLKLALERVALFYRIN